MKVLQFFIWIYFLQQSFSQGADYSSPPHFSNVTLACITFPELIKATASACMQKDNKELWQLIIDCHRPMTDQFMRWSSEARCPIPKRVENTMGTRYTIQEVFYNVCGLTEGNSTQRIEGLTCLLNGHLHPFMMSHELEVAVVKWLFGENVPCDIGKCIKALKLLGI